MVNPISTVIPSSRYRELLSNKSSQIKQSRQVLITGITILISAIILLLIGIALAVFGAGLPVTFSIGYIGVAAALLSVGVILTVVFAKRVTVFKRGLADYKALDKLDSEHGELFNLLKAFQKQINELGECSSVFQKDLAPLFEKYLNKLQTRFKITEERMSDFIVRKKIPDTEAIAELGNSIQSIGLEADIFRRLLDLNYGVELAGIAAENLCREPGFSVDDIPGITGCFKTLCQVIREESKTFLEREEKTPEEIQQEVDRSVARQAELDALLVSLTHLQGYAGGDMEELKRRMLEVAQSIKIALIETSTVETLKRLPGMFEEWEESWDSYWYNRTLELTAIKWGLIPREDDSGVLGIFKLDKEMDELAALLVKKATNMAPLKASVSNFALLSRKLTSLRARFDYVAGVGSLLNGATGFFQVTSQSISENEELIKRLIKEARFLYPQVGIYLRRLIQLSRMKPGNERTMFMAHLKQYVLAVAKENHINIPSEILNRNTLESFVECLLIFMGHINRILTRSEASRELIGELVKQKKNVNKIGETMSLADSGNLPHAYTNNFVETEDTLRGEMARLTELCQRETLVLQEHNLWAADVEKVKTSLKGRAAVFLQLHKLLRMKMEKNNAVVESRKEGSATAQQQEYERFDSEARSFIARDLPREMLEIYEQTPLVSIPGVLEDILNWMTACNALVGLANELLSRIQILMQGPNLLTSVELWLTDPENTSVPGRREIEELGDPVVKAAQDVVLHARSLGCENLAMEIETLLNPAEEYLTAYRVLCDRFEISLEEEPVISLIPLEEEESVVEQASEEESVLEEDSVYNLFD